MALLDLEGQALGQPIHALLGGAVRQHVPLYANINRRTVERTPASFAASAAVAIAAGYTSFKLAPFDEITPERCAEGDIASTCSTGSTGSRRREMRSARRPRCASTATGASIRRTPL